MNRYNFALSVLLLLSVLYPGVVRAASLSIVPDAATVTVGDTFGATVYLDSAGGSVNASDGTLTFPSDMVGARSVAYGNSIFTMWAQEPAINTDSVTWSGGSNVAFSGNHGRILRVVFVAKKVGMAEFGLPSSSIYADDGLGTNVATAPNTSSVTIVPAAMPVPQPSLPPSAGSLSGKKILISSPTNPSQDMWYASTTAKLIWEVPAGADAVKTALSERENAIPSVTYQPAITEKSLDKLPEGISYFSIRGHYADGWGPITSYRLQVDMTAPALSAVSVYYEASSSALFVSASSSDALSGVRDYSLIIDNATSTIFTLADVANDSYRAPINLKEGAHTAQIRVFDNAGNETDSKVFDLTVPVHAEKSNSIMAWIFSLRFEEWMLLLALLLALFSICMNVVLWMQLRNRERRIVHGVDVRKIRSLTIGQLMAFRKEIMRETSVLDRLRQRRDITLQEADEIREMHRHLIELEAFIVKQIEEIEK